MNIVAAESNGRFGTVGHYIVERLRCEAMQAYWQVANVRMKCHTFVTSAGCNAESVEIICDSAKVMREMEEAAPRLVDQMRELGAVVGHLHFTVGGVDGVEYDGPGCFCGKCGRK